MNIVITGGTKGIGKAIAEKFAEEGFNIAICARTKEDLKKLKKQLKKIYPKGSIITKKVDMQSKKQVEKFANLLLKKWGGVDVIVNNAAAFIQGSDGDKCLWFVLFDKKIITKFNKSKKRTYF